MFFILLVLSRALGGRCWFACFISSNVFCSLCNAHICSVDLTGIVKYLKCCYTIRIVFCIDMRQAEVRLMDLVSKRDFLRTRQLQNCNMHIICLRNNKYNLLLEFEWNINVHIDMTMTEAHCTVSFLSYITYVCNTQYTAVYVAVNEKHDNFYWNMNEEQD